jgi:hypothetical protein
MDNEIQLISDGDGLAVIGNPMAVERFLVSEGLPSKDLGLQRLGSALSTRAGVAQAGSAVAANSGRWVKLTEESAQLVKKFGEELSIVVDRVAGSPEVSGEDGGRLRGDVDLCGA